MRLIRLIRLIMSKYIGIKYCIYQFTYCTQKIYIALVPFRPTSMLYNLFLCNQVVLVLPIIPYTKKRL